ncbi:MAG: hypothetical protein PCFJNLEI_01295 [Verrucomicrobiae bacterium]|nr:hypothetical protein [Verrucomicrobiae bacterium]
MNKGLKFVFLSCGSLFVGSAIPAAVKLPSVFSDHMVLQCEQAVLVWGTAAAGEKVTVKFREQVKSTVADAAGKWQVKLDPLKAGGPDKLTVNDHVIDDVLVGEVWVGSGQSNMAMHVKGYTKDDPGLAELLAAAPYSQIRQMGLPGPWQVYCNGKWRVATASNAPHFSAQLFAFGVRLHRDLGVPVGLLLAAASGSPSGMWLSEAALKNDPACQAVIQKFAATFDATAERKANEAQRAQGKTQCGPRVPGEVYCRKEPPYYETYIRPLQPYGIRGVLWDQGENGTGIVGLNDQYLVIDALIRCWRQDWEQPQLPFLIVQKQSGGGCAWDYTNPITAKAEPFGPLPATMAGEPAWGAYPRLANLPHTGLVITSDLGGGQHPVNKSGYAHRAADVALGMVYGRKIQYYGPMYESHTVEGNKVRVTFKETGQGLAFKHGDKLQGFALSAEGQRFLWADAVIEGNTVVVSSPEVTKPAFVRYGWLANRPWANLFNKDGLPAVPFQTEQQR